MLLMLLGCAPDNTMVAAPGMPFELGEVASALFVTDYWASQQEPSSSDSGLLVLSSFGLTCGDVSAPRWRWDEERGMEPENDMVVIDLSWSWYPFDSREDTQPPISLGWAGLYAQSTSIVERVGDGLQYRRMDVTLWTGGTEYELYEASGLLEVLGVEQGKVQASLDHALLEATISALNCGTEEPETEDTGYYYY